MTTASFTVCSGRTVIGRVVEIKPERLEARDVSGRKIGIYGTRQAALTAVHERANTATLDARQMVASYDESLEDLICRREPPECGR